MTRKPAMAAAMPATVRKTRCAIYTRKSTDEGLDKEYNTLDAQRDACAAYIASQRHEGWLPLADRYDDGGFSGATLERPALRRLLADIEAGRVDVVVVYKIDRLSRALMDFAKLVEVFDRHGVTFVSVTQSFNTTTSMGRLTLNILLSFAQFEREVTRCGMSCSRPSRRGSPTRWSSGSPWARPGPISGCGSRGWPGWCVICGREQGGGTRRDRRDQHHRAGADGTAQARWAQGDHCPRRLGAAGGNPPGDHHRRSGLAESVGAGVPVEEAAG
jgi:hypothetical protein